jgi:hypothetical protein
MSKILSFAALLMLATAASPAAAADHCVFTSPASHSCPADVAPRLRAVTSNQVAADHCVALTPASTSCPAVPAAAVGLANAQSRPTVSLQASRN